MENPGRKERRINWHQYNCLVVGLAKKIDDEKIIDFDFITGIERGGAIVGVHLSHLLKKKYINFTESLTVRNGSLLVVDDIVDSGKTLSKLPQLFKTCFYQTAAIYLREKESSIIPNFYVKDAQIYWIKFPWEQQLYPPKKVLKSLFSSI